MKKRYFNTNKSCKFVCRLEHKIRKDDEMGKQKQEIELPSLKAADSEEGDLKRKLILMEIRRSCSSLGAQKGTKTEMESCENSYRADKSLVSERKRK